MSSFSQTVCYVPSTWQATKESEEERGGGGGGIQ